MFRFRSLQVPALFSVLLQLMAIGLTVSAASVFPEISGWNENGDINWSDPPSGWEELCGKVTTVFDVPVCVSKKAWKSEVPKCNHIVNVFYQLLDNNADGAVDDAKVHDEMVQGRYLLYVPKSWNELEDVWNFDFPGDFFVQLTGTFEAVPNACDVPDNRGASSTDRSTWGAAINLDGKNCDWGRDATVEETLHLITEAAATVYPSKWRADYKSEAGKAIKRTNGNCGWGYSDDWKDPSSEKSEGQYAYRDPTCDEGCIVTEGIYWAIISYMGGIYTTDRAEWVSDEWLMATPDKSMPVIPTGVTNAISLEEGSPKLYAMVSNSESEGHEWLPSIMPDGKYKPCHKTEHKTKKFTIRATGNKRTCEQVEKMAPLTKRWKFCKKSIIGGNSGKRRVHDACPVTCGRVGQGKCKFLGSKP